MFANRKTAIKESMDDNMGLNDNKEHGDNRGIQEIMGELGN